jgi:hypothetical protein
MKLSHFPLSLLTEIGRGGSITGANGAADARASNIAFNAMPVNSQIL